MFEEYSIIGLLALHMRLPLFFFSGCLTDLYFFFFFGFFPFVSLHRLLYDYMPLVFPNHLLEFMYV